MKQRIMWLDQLKALAVGVGILLYLLPMMLQDFNPQGQYQTLAVDLVRGLRFYLPLGLVLISGFSLYFHKIFSSKWWITKFTSLVLVSSWLYAIGQDQSHYYSMMIPCLFFYYPLWWYLKKKMGVEKFLLNLLLALSYFIGLKLSPQLLATPMDWASLNDAAAWQLIWFNLLSGLPMVILGSYLIPWIMNKDLASQRLNQAILALGLLVVIDALLYHFVFTFPVTSGYPPMLRQTWAGALAVLLGIKALVIINPISQLNFLTTLGRHSLLHYWTLWLLGTLVVSWNGLGKYEFNLISATGIILLIFVAYGEIKNRFSKAGMNIKE
jgi:hypothetical protein